MTQREWNRHGFRYGFVTVGQPACGRSLARASALTYGRMISAIIPVSRGGIDAKQGFNDRGATSETSPGLQSTEPDRPKACGVAARLESPMFKRH